MNVCILLMWEERPAPVSLPGYSCTICLPLIPLPEAKSQGFFAAVEKIFQVGGFTWWECGWKRFMSSHQPQAALAFRIQKWQLKPIRRNYGTAKSHTGLLWPKRRRIHYTLTKQTTNWIRNRPQHCDCMRGFVGVLFTLAPRRGLCAVYW